VARDVSATINGGAIMEFTYTGIILSWNDNPRARPAGVKDLISIYPNPTADIL